jgi:hypothetical protein
VVGFALSAPLTDDQGPLAPPWEEDRHAVRTIIQQSGKTATGIQVPAEVIDALGAGKRPAVTVTINGYTYRTTVAVMGGRYMIGVNAEHRAGAGVAGGEEVEVDLDLDTAPREVHVPADFAAALDAEPAARRTFDGLSYSNQSWHVLQVEGAKTDETRQRRIAKSVDILKQGRARRDGRHTADGLGDPVGTRWSCFMFASLATWARL